MPAVILAGVFITSGCNLVAPVYLAIEGPPKVKAEFELPRQAPAVIFVDDPNSLMPRRSLRVVLGQEAGERLLEKKRVDDVISTESAQAIAAKDRYDSPASITSIGQTVGASTVIWVGVEAFALAGDDLSYIPTAMVRVKVIDTTTGRRLWPDDPRGFPVALRMPVRAAEEPLSIGQRAQAELELARFAGHGVAELFYDEERRTSARAGQEPLP